jgi:histidinol-phosphate aminotransferase
LTLDRVVFEAYQRGTSVEEARRRFGLRDVIKLASNENPLGTSPKAVAAIRSAIDRLNVYVDDSYTNVKEKIAARHALRTQNVILGHGSNEIVRLVADAFLQSGDEAVMAAPTFSLYRLAAAVRGARALQIPLRDGVTDLEAMLATMTDRTQIVFVCEPNNPTGMGVDVQAWRDFVKRLPARIVLVVDQAYREYAPAGAVDAIETLRIRPRTLVLRTMSKIYGLAALRFGYGFADAETIALLERIRLPFNVALPALTGAEAALDDEEFARRSVTCNEEGKALLFPVLAEMGLHLYPTQANFYALQVPIEASRAYDDLLRTGVIVRSGDAFGMAGRLRITIGTREQNLALLDALKEMLPRWRSEGGS